MKAPQGAGALRPLPSLVFASGWLQLKTFINAAAYDERTLIAAPARHGEQA